MPSADAGRKDVSVCLSFDFDAISIWVGPHRSTSPVLVSRGEFGEVGAGRLVDLLGEHDVAATWFVPGHTIDTFPDVCERIVAAGHELGYHGYCHEAPSSRRDEGDERAILEKSMAAVERIAGRPPLGHRLPGGNLGDRWTKLLVEYGFSYDSSLMANDFTPTWCRVGDVVHTDRAHAFGQPVDLVELPFDWSLDDWPYFSIHMPDHFVGLRSPYEVEQIWRDDFDYLYQRLGRGVFVLTMHPQCIGRGHRLAMLERLIGYMAGHPGVRFVTMADVAAAWRTSNPLPADAAAGAVESASASSG